MPDSTPILQLPYILPSQAQKHVTHNEAIRLLDVIVQLSVMARDVTTPPANPAQGDRYILANGANGAWAGRDGQIALFENGAWQFFAPMAGWTAWVMAESVLASYDGIVWTSQADGPFNIGQLGVSATPDAVNRLIVSSPASLLNHAGAGHQLKLNKAASSDTASLLFQTGFSGRAEMGTIGQDNFAIKVSADGVTFVTGLSIASEDGAVTLPAGAKLGGQPVDPVAPPDGTIWLNSTSGEVKMQSGGATVTIAQGGGAALADGNRGDISLSAAGSIWQINPGAVGNAQLAPMASGTIKARRNAGAGAPEDVTPADVAQLLPVFDSVSKGLVPPSGGGTAHFLRADGTWGAPAGGGGGGSMTLLGTLNTTSGNVQVLSGLDLTPYQEIRCFVRGLSHDSTAGRGVWIVANSGDNLGTTLVTSFVNTSQIFGTIHFSLVNGIGVAALAATSVDMWRGARMSGDPYAIQVAPNNASTEIIFKMSGGAQFTQGQILIYGVR